jgi:DNA primase
LFDKGKNLFALDKASSAIAKQDKAIVVEGYFDAIALHSAGITNAVASLGTALTLDQMKLLLKFTESKQVILNFDADTAGVKATNSAIATLESLVYAGQVNLKVLSLKGSKDADDFVRQSGAEAYSHLVEKAPSWMEWKIAQLIAGRDLSQPDSYQKVVVGMVSLLGKVEDLGVQSFFLNHCAQLLAQGNTHRVRNAMEMLQRQLRKPMTEKKKSAIASHARPVTLLEEAESLLIRVYLHQPEYRDRITEMMDERDLVFCFSAHRTLWQLVLQGKENLWEEIAGHEEEKAIARLLSEPPQEDRVRTPVQINAAIACLEKISLEKHKKHCLEQWDATPMSDIKRKTYYWEEAARTTKEIERLEAIRLDHGTP